jgi:hypothetical protein
MADKSKGGSASTPKPQPKPAPPKPGNLSDFGKSDRATKVTSDQAPPERPKKG